MFFAMTTQAIRIYLLGCQVLKTDDFADVTTTFDVCGSRSVTRFATMPVQQGCFEVWCLLEILFVEVLVAGLACICADVFGTLRAWIGRFLFLRRGGNRSKDQ